MDPLRMLTADPFNILDRMLDIQVDYDTDNEEEIKAPQAHTRRYYRDAKAMAATPADVKEYLNQYVFVLDMPGLKPSEVKVQVEDGNMLVVSGKRMRESEKKEGVKYLKMERRLGKFLKKFVLPETANTEKISAVYKDGVLTVTVEKVSPPEPKKPKTIEVTIG